MAAQQDGAIGGQEEQWTDCLSQSDATELDNALFFDYEYSIDQLMEIAGLCIAQVNVIMAAINVMCLPGSCAVSGSLLPTSSATEYVQGAVGLWTWKQWRRWVGCCEAFALLCKIV